MTTDVVNILREKAKTRRDNIYSYGSYLYAVKDGKFIAFVEYGGQCFQMMGMCTISIGKVGQYERKKALMDWLKKQ